MEKPYHLRIGTTEYYFGIGHLTKVPFYVAS